MNIQNKKPEAEVPVKRVQKYRPKSFLERLFHRAEQALSDIEKKDADR